MKGEDNKMNKEEYAQFHYLLAKMKYELCKSLCEISNEAIIKDYNKKIESIDNIMNYIIINGDEND